MLWVAENRLVNDLFGAIVDPNHPVTLEELAVILKNYAYFKGHHAEFDPYGEYEGLENVSPEALPAMQWAQANDIIAGPMRVELEPRSGATNAETIEMLRQLIENVL